jgi:hypothetical protein
VLPRLFSDAAATSSLIAVTHFVVTDSVHGQVQDKLTPEQRDQFVRIKTKMMQAQMEHGQAVTQMDMKYAQAMMEMQKQLMDLYRGH